MQELEIQVEPEEFVNNINFDYNPLTNKPSINDIPLEGNKTLEDLGIQPKGDYITEEELNNKVDELNAKDIELDNKVKKIEKDYITKDVDNLVNYKDSKEVDRLLNLKADKTELPKSLSELNNDVGFIKKDSIPTKNSQLQNDSGFITSNEIPSTVSSFENDANYAKTEQLPTKVSDLANDSEFITKLVDNLVNYYKKTEIYTKGEVNTLIEALHSVNIKKVESLPEVGETNTIYFVETQKPQEDNYYDEFMFFEDRWEKIGSTKVDFSDYTDNDQLKELLASYVTNETFLIEIQKKLDVNSSNYIKKLTIEGKTITYTKGDDTTGTLETKDTTYTEATSSSSGLMSAQDKSKLDTLAIPTQLSDLTNDTGFITEKDLPKNVSDLNNDSNYINEETDPTVPNHVKSISEENISSWNNKAETEAIPTKMSQLLNDIFILANSEEEALEQSASNPDKIYYWVEE